MEIIFLEDDANMRMHTAELLKERGYPVLDFPRIDQVKEYLQLHSNSISCIITDLNMSDEWLDEYQPESDGCMLSGWVWLKYFVFTQHPDIPTIIYSGYNTYLKEYLHARDRLNEIERKNLYFINKGAEQGEGFAGLIDLLENLGVQRNRILI